MRTTKEALRSHIEAIIAEGVMQCEEIDVTTEKVLEQIWPVIDYHQQKMELHFFSPKEPGSVFCKYCDQYVTDKMHKRTL